MSADPTAAPRRDERTEADVLWGMISAARLAVFEYSHAPSGETLHALLSHIDQAREYTADVLGPRLAKLESALLDLLAAVDESPGARATASAVINARTALRRAVLTGGKP